MALNANDFNFENNLNNRIATINNDILNHRLPRVPIRNRIYYNENGVSGNVQFVLPDNWVHFLENDVNNNYHTIRINYEYFIICYYRDLERIITLRDTLMQIANIDGNEEEMNEINNIDGNEEVINEINNVNNTINDIANAIINVGNIYLGILYQLD